MAIYDNNNQGPKQGNNPNGPEKVSKTVYTDANGTTRRTEEYQEYVEGHDSFKDTLKNPKALSKYNWLNLGELNTYQVNTTIASQDLIGLEKAINEFLNDYISRDLEVKVIPIDKGSVANLAVSLIAIAVRAKSSLNNDPHRPVAYHVLLIEGSIESLPARILNLGHRQIEIMTLTSDLYDRKLLDKAEEAVVRVFPDAKEIVCAQGEVIHRNFNLTEKESIHRVIVNAVVACQTRLSESTPGFVDLNLNNAEQNSAYLAQTITFSKGIEEDMCGNPIRSDITMNMIAQANVDPSSRWVNESKVITHATGYIDLIYNDVNQFFGVQGFNPNQNMQTIRFPDGTYMTSPNTNVPQQVYQAQFVITQLLNAKIQTLPGVLLALLNVTAIRENDAWIQALMPDHHNGREELHDIGTVGYDISLTNDGNFEKLKTTPDQFGYSELYQFIQRYFHGGLVFSLDIPDCEGSSWMYRVLLAAANGVDYGKKAVFEAANTLTAGAFERHYKKLGGTGSPLTGSEYTSRILLGHYTDSQSVRRDIRDFDYLAVCGLAGKKGRDEVMAYTDTYNAIQEMSVEERLDMRRKIIASYFHNVQYTGYATRVTFEAAFIEALIRGSMDCNYTVSTQLPIQDNMMGQRANGGYVAGCILGNNTSGIFNTNVNNLYRSSYMAPNPAFNNNFNNFYHSRGY